MSSEQGFMQALKNKKKQASELARIERRISEFNVDDGTVDEAAQGLADLERKRRVIKARLQAAIAQVNRLRLSSVQSAIKKTECEINKLRRLIDEIKEQGRKTLLGLLHESFVGDTDTGLPTRLLALQKPREDLRLAQTRIQKHNEVLAIAKSVGHTKNDHPRIVEWDRAYLAGGVD